MAVLVTAGVVALLARGAVARPVTADGAAPRGGTPPAARAPPATPLGLQLSVVSVRRT